MRFCLDASFLVATLLPEQRTAAVDAFWVALTDADELVGPHLLLAESSSVIREQVYAGRVTHANSMLMVQEMTAFPIRISTASGQFTRAVELAHRTHRLRSYDMQYVAVAELEGCEMVTLDGGVYQVATEIGVRARLLR